MSIPYLAFPFVGRLDQTLEYLRPGGGSCIILLNWEYGDLDGLPYVDQDEDNVFQGANLRESCARRILEFNFSIWIKLHMGVLNQDGNLPNPVWQTSPENYEKRVENTCFCHATFWTPSWSYQGNFIGSRSCKKMPPVHLQCQLEFVDNRGHSVHCSFSSALS